MEQKRDVETTGNFEVTVNGDLIHSKQAGHGFLDEAAPKQEEVKAAIQKAVDAEKPPPPSPPYSSHYEQVTFLSRPEPVISGVLRKPGTVRGPGDIDAGAQSELSADEAHSNNFESFMPGVFASFSLIFMLTGLKKLCNQRKMVQVSQEPLVYA